MSATKSIKRNIGEFKGLHRGHSDLTRPEFFATTATNVRHTRVGGLSKRRGFRLNSGGENQMGYGLHKYEYSIPSPLQDTGFQTGNSASSLAGGGSAWSNPSNALTSDDVRAFTSITGSSTNNLLVQDFGFDIPEDSIIVGVEVNAEIQGVTGSYDFQVSLTDDGGTTTGSPHIRTLTQSGVDQVFTFGSESHTFGLTGLTPSIVNSSNFGAVYRVSSGTTSLYEVDSIAVKVYYRRLALNNDVQFLAAGKQLLRQQIGILSITYKGIVNGPATLNFAPNSSGEIELNIEDGAGPLVGPPYTYGTGVLSGSTVYDVFQDLVGTTLIDATLTPYAIVNGTQTTTTTVTINSTNSIPQGEWLKIPDSDLGHSVSGRVVDVTATEIDFGALPSQLIDRVLDDTILGVGGERAAIIPWQENLSLPSNEEVQIEIPYWVPAPHTTEVAGAVGQPDRTPLEIAEWTNSARQYNVPFVSNRSVVYFSLPSYGTYSFGEKEQATGLWKYDGLEYYWAGLPEIENVSLTSTDMATDGSETSTNLSPGDVYRYRFQFIFNDGAGNFIEGPLTDAQKITIQGGDDSVAISFGAILADLRDTPFPTRLAEFEDTTAQTAVNHISVEPDSTNVLPTQTIFLWDDGTEAWVTRVVRDYAALKTGTGYAIEIEGEPVDIDTTAYTALETLKAGASTLGIRLWRTRAGGNLFYYWGDVPAFTQVGVSNFLDSKADDDLGDELIEPDRFPSLFPKMGILTKHQGLLVGAGNPDAPEDVYYADSVSFEFAPASTNRFSASIGESSEVTALASDTDEMLAVFKDRSYINVVGDLDSLSFSLLLVSNGDYGCPAPSAIVRMRNHLLFPSHTGFKAISAGRLVTDFQDRLGSDFENNFYLQRTAEAIKSRDEDKLVLRRATAAYNAESHEYICFIPAESGTPLLDGDLLPNSNSKIYVYNQLRDSWTEWSTSNDYNMAGGIIVHDDKFHWASRLDDGSNKITSLGLSQNRFNSALDYADNVSAIRFTLTPQWDFVVQPSNFFRPLWLKLYQYDPDSFVANFVLALRERRNFDTGANYYTQVERAFTSVETEKRIKFKSGKARAIQLEFSEEALFTTPVITGWEYLVADPYAISIKGERS